MIARRIEMPEKKSHEEIRAAVKQRYGQAITTSSGCCGPKDAGQFAQLAGYGKTELSGLPNAVTSFGCGNPVAYMHVKVGETVLDPGSGAGLDMILAAKKVGPGGKVIGLDMTPEMIEVCRRNLKQAGLANAEVRQGEMEQMPVANGEVDWIMSNCVINLSPEKERVFAEAFRVLKPGGQILVSDIVTHDLPDAIRNDMLAWVGCIGGAVEEQDYLRMVREAGFEEVRIVHKLEYTPESLRTLASDPCGCTSGSTIIPDEAIEQFAGRVASIKLYARKPA